MQDIDKALKKVIEKDSRYSIEAYKFIYEALEFTYQMVGQRRHVTGQELLEGIRQYAIEQFGMLARMVFNSWGIYRTEDFGEIVFNLVEAGLLGKTEQDSKDDFQKGFDFDTAFNI